MRLRHPWGWWVLMGVDSIVRVCVCVCAQACLSSTPFVFCSVNGSCVSTMHAN